MNAQHPHPAQLRRNGWSGHCCALAALLAALLSTGPTRCTVAAAPEIVSITPIAQLTIQSDPGIQNQIEFTSVFAPPVWTVLSNVTVTHSPYQILDTALPPSPHRFYRVATDTGHVATLAPPQFVRRLIIASETGVTNEVQYTPDPMQSAWTTLTNVIVTASPYAIVDDTTPFHVPRVYRVIGPGTNQPPPAQMVYIPAGGSQMGDALDGLADAQPVHTVLLSAFYMDPTEITQTLWEEVYQWAITNGYDFSAGIRGVASNHPVHSVTWYDAVKWCNARSEREGRVPAYYANPGTTIVYRHGVVGIQNSWVLWDAGYRLPTEAEWEKAARGGTAGRRFPWADADTISHARANFYSFWQNGQPLQAYDTSTTNGYHPDFSQGTTPYTSPARSFPANDYGVYDLAGNVWEWCSDWWSDTYYAVAAETNPLGPASGMFRVLRGGSWATQANGCRVANRGNATPDDGFNTVGFRSVLPAH